MICAGAIRKKIAFAVCCLCAVVMLGCDLDDDDKTVNIPVAYVSLYQASPNAPNLDIVVDNRVININTFAYADYTGYLRFFTGERNIKFRPAAASSVAIDTTFSLEANNAYSIFVVDDYDDAQALLLKDNTETPASGKAKVRFVNLSPDVQPVNLTATGIEANTFNDIPFQESSDFKEVTAAQYDFLVQANSGQQTLLNIPDITLQPGWYYTILVRGYATPPVGNTNVLSAQVIVN
jgi:hypothetical protein